MNDKQLRLFIIVADEGSFTKAERSSFATKQAILWQINSLEEEVGTTLLQRTSKGILLTPAGSEFYKRAKKIIRLWDETLASCKGSQAEPPCIRIGQVEHQVLLHPVTEAFTLKYPDIPIKKVIHPNHSGEYRVEHSIIDVGESFYAQPTARSTNVYTRLADMPYLTAMSPHHPLSGRSQLSLSDLADYQTIFFTHMVKAEYQQELRHLFQALGKENNLIPREDVDNQVEVAFHCGSSLDLLLTANPFVTHIPQVTTVPLDNGWFQEYGIIHRPSPSAEVQKYVDLAVSIYQSQ